MEALAAVRELLEGEVCAGPLRLRVSRLDPYADAQGWRLEAADVDRFVTRAEHRHPNIEGHRFTGYVFGKGRAGLMARLYDKDFQMETAGLTWMHEVWRGRVEGEIVWRLEFEVKRELLGRLEAQEPEAVLERLPGLWAYCTGDWLTLRTRTGDAVRGHWPLDPMWVEAQGLMGGVQAGAELVWQAADAADEERVLAVIQGALTTWAAMRGIEEPKRACRAIVLRVERYLARKDRTFGGEVRRKRDRLRARGVRRAVLSRRVRLGVPATDAGAGEPKAQEERIVTSDRPFGADRPEGTRVGQSTFLARPAEDTTGSDSGSDRTISTLPVSGGERQVGPMEAQRSGAAVNRRRDGGQSDAGRDETDQRGGTEGEPKQPGEDGREHHRGHEDDGGERGDGGGRAMASVGAEPPSRASAVVPGVALPSVVVGRCQDGGTVAGVRCRRVARTERVGHDRDRAGPRCQQACQESRCRRWQGHIGAGSTVERGAPCAVRRHSRAFASAPLRCRQQPL
ncbi:MAG: hypothetical protein E6J41_07000 [Chloroflexi bacterium]|nr:MAG: hypothetical protein E6J41_07000 [Chloroflexota bacterium]